MSVLAKMLWFNWGAFLTIGLVLVSIVAVAVGYLVKVVRPQYPPRG